MEVICLDTNILIEYWRAKGDGKKNTKVVHLSSQYQFAVSVIVAYELLRGDNSVEDVFWKNFFDQVIILEMDIEVAEIAGNIYRGLRKQGIIIGAEDILIAATAMKHGLKLATANSQHFSRITNLELL